MSSQIWWYTARAGGIVAWGVLTASVVWGLALSTKVLKGRPRPNWILDLHRFLGGLGVVFTGIHVLGLVLDSYVHFGPTELLVPFTGTWHPVAVAWGVISMYLLAAVEVTSLLRRRLSKRAWRLTHFLSFPLYLLATAHGLSAGTDAGSRLFSVAAWLSLAVVAGLTVVRATRTRPRALPQSRPMLERTS